MQPIQPSQALIDATTRDMYGPGWTEEQLHEVAAILAAAARVQHTCLVAMAVARITMQATSPADDPIVGHKTIRAEDGSTHHEPLHKSESDQLMAQIQQEKQRRAELMPTEQDAARLMCSAHHRLKELGWRETCYGPTNIVVQLIEPGSSGIHKGIRHEPWPEKTWWIDGDWPSNPCLFKAIDEAQA